MGEGKAPRTMKSHKYLVTVLGCETITSPIRSVFKKGEWVWGSREVHDGEFVKGEIEGHGTRFYPNGEYYTGGWHRYLPTCLI